MRVIPVAAAALVGAAALALPVPAAVAGGGDPAVRFTVAPSTAAPGGRVALSASGCASAATATSGLFDTVTIQPGTSATATVDPDARRGAQYAVQFTCGTQRGTVNLTIAGATATPTTSSTSLPVAPATPAATPSATATTPQGVRGGLGGSIGDAGPKEVAIGAGMVLVAAAGTGWAVRRRARPHGH
ncbi:hypothetical protein ACH41E_23560 [Streptomyces sp. NPDC020412]|uniref:hypothetical protein n=1 Tax=Streptomyces sp. NPDC020412 TaxID=3365073 RepID=UPI0037AA800C